MEVVGTDPWVAHRLVADRYARGRVFAERLGKAFGDALVDLSVAAPALPGSVIGLLEAGQQAPDLFAAVREDGPGRLPTSGVKLHAQVPYPEKFLAIGMNYKEHAAEAKALGVDVPEWQVWFNKQVSCIAIENRIVAEAREQARPE